MVLYSHDCGDLGELWSALLRSGLPIRAVNAEDVASPAPAGLSVWHGRNATAFARALKVSAYPDGAARSRRAGAQRLGRHLLRQAVSREHAGLGWTSGLGDVLADAGPEVLACRAGPGEQVTLAQSAAERFEHLEFFRRLDALGDGDELQALGEAQIALTTG